MIDPARCLVVVATDREAAPFRSAGLRTVVSGVGRVNAAVATTIAIQGLESTPFVIASGIAGSLPRPDARSIGDIVIGDRAIAADEGIRTPTGFQSIAEMGFPLAGFMDGDAVLSDVGLVRGLAARLPDAVVGPIATVGTCSGTDDLASELAARTGAIAEAMEGAAVLQAAGLLGARAVEVRVISNGTGDRARQVWDLDKAFSALVNVAEAIASD
ncbi:MAG: futalosine hydrolase [Planctomycetia bacterium]|nr:futalosine hydrolase [Planctomycetia bacterium]